MHERYICINADSFNSSGKCVWPKQPKHINCQIIENRIESKCTNFNVNVSKNAQGHKKYVLQSIPSLVHLSSFMLKSWGILDWWTYSLYEKKTAIKTAWI